ncbi:hypothetical protein JCM8547_009104 [Rhodosporidiobolus lusitaniae]
MAGVLHDSLDALDLADPSLDLALVISSLESSEREGGQDIVDELQSLQAIYAKDDDSPILTLYRPPSSSRAAATSSWSPSSPDPLRLVLTTTLSDPLSDTPLHLLLSLPPGYPSTAPSLIQLQDRYLSSFQTTDELFGAVLRTFMHDSEAAGSGAVQGPVVEWTEGGVCLFEGVEAVREMCTEWVKERMGEKQRGEEERRRAGGGEEGRRTNGRREMEELEEGDEEDEFEEKVEEIERERTTQRRATVPTVKCPRIVSGEPLVDRKSVFIGHAARVTSLDEVEAVMAELLSNSKIARATHNMSAYQFTSPDGIRRADNDDDGESAAGSRLAQLLTLLDIDNVMIVVTRFYGGIHLGPTRFKDINLAARDALEAAGFLQDEAKDSKGGKGGKKR